MYARNAVSDSHCVTYARRRSEGGGSPTEDKNVWDRHSDAATIKKMAKEVRMYLEYYILVKGGRDVLGVITYLAKEVRMYLE